MQKNMRSNHYNGKSLEELMAMKLSLYLGELEKKKSECSAFDKIDRVNTSLLGWETYIKKSRKLVNNFKVITVLSKKKIMKCRGHPI